MCIYIDFIMASQSLTVVELRKLCKQKGIKGYSGLKKADLIKKCRAKVAKERKRSGKPSKKIDGSLTVKQLKDLCRSKGIKGYSGLKKAELIKKCRAKIAEKRKAESLLTVVELKKLCKGKGIKGYSGLKKADLIKKCSETKKGVGLAVHTQVKFLRKSGIGQDAPLLWDPEGGDYIPDTGENRNKIIKGAKRLHKKRMYFKECVSPNEIYDYRNKKCIDDTDIDRNLLGYPICPFNFNYSYKDRGCGPIKEFRKRKIQIKDIVETAKSMRAFERATEFIERWEATGIVMLLVLLRLSQKYQDICIVLPEPTSAFDFKSISILWLCSKNYSCNLYFPPLFWFTIYSCKKRFILVNVVLEDTEGAHDNIMIIDRTKKTAEIFEPHGGTTMLFSREEFDKEMKKKLKNYYDLTYIPSSEFCPQFQVTRRHIKNIDPEGYCGAWSMWYGHMRLEYPDLDRKALLNIMIKEFKNDPRIMRRYIRNYAQFLLKWIKEYKDNPKKIKEILDIELKKARQS